MAKLPGMLKGVCRGIRIFPNARGVLQARQMAQVLKDIKLTFDVLYTSDLKRAADTANAVVELFGVNAQVDSELRERHFGASRTFN